MKPQNVDICTGLNEDHYDLIEDTLEKHQDVKECVLFFVPEICTTAVAAIVPETYTSAVEIREFLWTELGYRRAPDVVVLLPEIPKDRDGRPAVGDLVRLVSSLEKDRLSRYVEPSTDLEKQLHAVFCEVLNVPRIGVNDGFVDAGGDSHTAMALCATIEERYELSISPEEVFEATDIRTLASQIEAR